MARVLLVRHGETAWNREGRVQGWAPTALTDRGHAQASALGVALAADDSIAVDRLIASDLRRTRLTAGHLADPLGLDPVFESAWRERDFGHLQGLLAADLYDQYPEFSIDHAGADAAAARPRSGESFLDVRNRVVDRYRTLRADLAADETALVVAHGGSIKLLLGHVRGQDVVSAFEQPTNNCGLSTVEVVPDGDPDGTDDEVVAADDTSRVAE
jgi:probable phosphoglycerate mutase